MLFAKDMDQNWFFARMGGDEFGVIAEQIEQPEAFAEQISGLLSQIATKEHPNETGQYVDAAAGYTVLSKGSADTRVLLRRADLALYQAKREPHARVRCFEMPMEEAFRHRVLVSQEFRQGLRDEQIIPHYQPVIRLDTGQIIGLEALARWDRPGKGIQSPALFMEVFGDREICVLLTELMLRQICEDMRQWVNRGIRFGRTSVNVTAADLQQPGFALSVINTLMRHDLRPHHLILEMTETTALAGMDKEIVQQVQHLRDAGVTIALDDFGTGYSSLTHLKSMPIDILKIDRSFVKDITRSQSSRAIVQALIKLGDEIGYSTIAEGIELRSEANYLRDIGCKSGQGYFFHKPMPKEDIENLLAPRTQIAL